MSTLLLIIVIYFIPTIYCWGKLWRRIYRELRVCGDWFDLLIIGGLLAPIVATLCSPFWPVVYICQKINESVDPAKIGDWLSGEAKERAKRERAREIKKFDSIRDMYARGDISLEEFENSIVNEIS